MIVPDLIDVFTPTKAYLWLRLWWDGDDFDIELAGDAGVGDRPAWLDYELSGEGPGWEGLIGADPCWLCNGFGTWTMWALKHGVAPRQPFLVCLHEPVYSRDYWGEHDVDYESEFVRAMPWPADRTTRTWHRYLRVMTRPEKS